MYYLEHITKFTIRYFASLFVLSGGVWVNMKWVFFAVAFLTIIVLSLILMLVKTNRRRDCEKSLPDSVKILRATLNATDNGILVVDNERQVLEVNDLYFKMWNIPWDIYSLNSETENLKFINNQLYDSDTFVAWVNFTYEVPVTEHYTTYLIDGRMIEVFSTPLMDKENMIGRVWSFRDITERKQNEELKYKIDENMKLVRETYEYDKIKTEFFGNISHEIKTPLNIIIGTLQLFELNLSNQNTDPIFDKLTKYTAIMRQNCFRLLRMLNNLIYITEIDSGFVEIHLQNHDLVQIVKDIIFSSVKFIESKGVRFDANIGLDSLEMACDADKIEIVLLNILSNAVKFTEKEGEISVSLYSNGEYAYISVKDTGIGIPDEMKDVIFQKFRQVDKSFTRKCEGSGIGLSLVKSLVEMHKGSIEVNSEYGKGSEFILKLPIWLIDNDEIAATAEETASVCIDRAKIEFSDIYYY